MKMTLKHYDGNGNLSKNKTRTSDQRIHGSTFPEASAESKINAKNTRNPTIQDRKPHLNQWHDGAHQKISLKTNTNPKNDKTLR